MKYIIQESHGDMWFDLYSNTDKDICEKILFVMREKNKSLRYRMIGVYYV